MIRRPPRSTRSDHHFPCTTLFRSSPILAQQWGDSSFGNKDLETPFCEGSSRVENSRIDGFWRGRRISSGSLRAWRSEEHTSELQSLMSISYAVFCLKKKTNNLI